MSGRQLPDVAFLREMLGHVNGSPNQAGLCLGALLVGAERDPGARELEALLREQYRRTQGDAQITRPELERVLREVEAAVIELGRHWTDTLYELASEVVQRLRDALAATDW